MEKAVPERRKFERVGIDIAVKVKIVDPQKKIDVSRDIVLRAKNLSEGGALLDWPRSWDCDICSNCLGWIYNFSCKLKEKGRADEEFNKDLVPELHVNLRIAPGDNIEPVETLTKVKWVSAPEDPSADRYPVGVSFIDEEKKESDLKKKIQVIKKRFEAN
jgi:hypothetical protein